MIKANAAIQRNSGGGQTTTPRSASIRCIVEPRRTPQGVTASTPFGRPCLNRGAQRFLAPGNTETASFALVGLSATGASR